MDRAPADPDIAAAGIAQRPDRQRAAVQRDRRPEIVIGVQNGRNVEILAAGIARADPGFQRATAEQRIGKAEQVDGPAIGQDVAAAIVAGGADREPVVAQRHGSAEVIQGVQAGDRQVLAAGIAVADHRLQIDAAKFEIGKAEQIDRAGKALAIVGPVIASGPDRQAQTIERDRRAEAIVIVETDGGGGRADQIQPGHRAIACAQGRGQPRPAKTRIGKGEQMDRARTGDAVASATVARRADGEAIAVERHRLAEQVEILDADRQVLAAAIAEPDDRFLHGRGQRGIGKAEQIDRTGGRAVVERAAILARAHGQPVAIERDTRSEAIRDAEIGHIDIVGARIAQPQGRDMGKVGKGRALREGEGIDRADGAARSADIACTLIVGRADDELAVPDR